QQIDIIRAQSAERGGERFPCRFGCEITAVACGHDHPVALAFERAAEQLLGLGRTGVEQSAAEIERATDHAHRAIILARPARQPDLAYLAAGATERTLAHGGFISYILPRFRPRRRWRIR